MQSPNVQRKSMHYNGDGPSLQFRQSSSDQQSFVSVEEGISISEAHGKRQRLRLFSNKTKQKTKKILHFTNQKSLDENAYSEGVGIIKNDPAFNPSMLEKQQHTTTDEPTRQGLGGLQSATTAVIHPIKSIKKKATKITAGKLSNAERPYLSQNADLDLLNAHKDMDQAYSSLSSRHDNLEDEGDEVAHNCRSKVAEIEAHRESLRVAWMTSKHISRVRVVPKRHIQYPDMAKFYVKGGNESPKFDWLKWIGYYLIYYTQDFCVQYIDDFDELPFDINSLRHHIERIAVASAPWQLWAMSVRSVYRWEDKYTTGKWLIFYIALWYTEHVMAFLYSYILFIVIRNHYFPTSVESLQDSMQRTLENTGKPYKFGELIDKHGRDGWIEPLLNDLGPYIQLQLGDVANMLEVFHNFYHWKSPRKTVASLAFFASCLLVALLADMKFCMKIVWFIAGGSFFFCWPIASLYPKYRYLVSPFKWVLWDIPTDAEWSFQYLRRHAQISRERMIQDEFKNQMKTDAAKPKSVNSNNYSVPLSAGSKTDSDTDNHSDQHSPTLSSSFLDSSAIISFRARSQGKSGHLIIHPGGIRFVRRLMGTELWRRTYLELAEMRKREGSLLSKLSMKSLEQLELKCSKGDVLLLDAMKDRDEAFNSIIGFSALQWQALQTDPSKRAEDTRER